MGGRRYERYPRGNGESKGGLRSSSSGNVDGGDECKEGGRWGGEGYRVGVGVDGGDNEQLLVALCFFMLCVVS